MIAINGDILLKIFIICRCFTNSLDYYKCKHKPLNKSQIYPGNKILPSTLRNYRRFRFAFSHLRLHFEYLYSFKQVKDHTLIQSEVLEPVKERLESIIKVKNPTNGILRVQRHCLFNRVRYDYLNRMACARGCQITSCNGIVVPEKFLNKCYEFKNKYFERTGSEGSGVEDIDMVLLVAVSDCDSTVLATAASCFLEDRLDRPILGVLNLCKYVINPGEEVIHNRLIIMHEIIHALGFSADKYAFFRSSDGWPIIPRDKRNWPNTEYNETFGGYHWSDRITKIIERQRSSIHWTYTKKAFALTLPTVLGVAKKHFNCPTLDGLDLEPYPLVSHFSEYALYNELMTPISDGAATSLSKFTLAFLRDTGWYDADFYNADYYTYGKGKGCGVILDGCYKYMNDQKAKGLSIAPFCDTVYRRGGIYTCSGNRKYFEFCYIIKHKSLDKDYQYFRHLEHIRDNETSFYGGAQIDAEFCPLLRVQRNSLSICAEVSNKGKKTNFDILQSYYGVDSACFENGIVGTVTNRYFGASCRKYTVHWKMLIVYFEDATIACPTNDTISFHTKDYYYIIYFECPNIEEFIKEIAFKNSNIIWMSISFILSCVLLSTCLYNKWGELC